MQRDWLGELDFDASCVAVERRLADEHFLDDAPVLIFQDSRKRAR